jgi:hypothetical protein
MQFNIFTILLVTYTLYVSVFSRPFSGILYNELVYMANLHIYVRDLDKCQLHSTGTEIKIALCVLGCISITQHTQRNFYLCTS